MPLTAAHCSVSPRASSNTSPSTPSSSLLSPARVLENRINRSSRTTHESFGIGFGSARSPRREPTWSTSRPSTSSVLTCGSARMVSQLASHESEIASDSLPRSTHAATVNCPVPSSAGSTHTTSPPDMDATISSGSWSSSSVCQISPMPEPSRSNTPRISSVSAARSAASRTPDPVNRESTPSNPFTATTPTALPGATSSISSGAPATGAAIAAINTLA